MRLQQFLPILLVMACSADEGLLKKVATLPLEEVSGIEYTAGKLWAIEDSGNKNIIYGLGKDGSIETEITLSSRENTDWEEIASDADGNIYIGDFGNNDNDRKDLAIYKVDKGSLQGKTVEASSITTFKYPEQTEFPPKKSGRYFDVEAFFEHKGNFYLFTKNRSSDFNGDLNIYKIPNRAGDYNAQLLGKINTCGVYKKCAVTAADISPDGETVVLLAGDRLWLLTGFGTDNFTKANMQEYTLGKHTQKEGICFTDNNTLLITDEKDKKDGGFIYELKISDLKGKP